MASKLFERRKAMITARTASGEGFLTDRDENIEEVNTDDVRLAAKKKAEVPPTPPPAGPNPFKQLPSSALLAISEAIVNLDEYATDKSLQGAVVQISQEINSRPVPPPAMEAPRTASSLRDRIIRKRLAAKKKADLESTSLTQAEDRDGLLAKFKQLLYSLDGSYTPLQLHAIVDQTIGKTAGKKKADGVSIDVSPDGNVHVETTDNGSAMGEGFDVVPPVPQDVVVNPLPPVLPLEETPIEPVDEEVVVEDVDFPKEDWEADVSNDLTKLSYNKWVEEKTK